MMGLCWALPKHYNGGSSLVQNGFPSSNMNRLWLPTSTVNQGFVSNPQKYTGIRYTKQKSQQQKGVLTWDKNNPGELETLEILWLWDHSGAISLVNVCHPVDETKILLTPPKTSTYYRYEKIRLALENVSPALNIFVILGIYLKFLGRKTPEYFHQRQHGIDMLNPTNPGTMLGRTRLTFIFSKKSKAIFQSWLFLSESKKFCCHTLVKENGTTNHLPSGKIILLVSHLQMYSVRSEKMQLSLLPELPSSSHWWSWERNHKSAMFEASFARAC